MVGNQVQEASLLRSFPKTLIQLVFVGFLFIAPWFYGLTRFRDQLFAQSFILSLFLVAAPLVARKDALKIGQNPFDTWVFISLVSGFLSFLFSTFSYPSLLALFRLLSCAVCYGLVRSMVRTEKALRVFLWAILVLGLFYSSYGLFQYYGFLPCSFWYQPNSLASRYINGGHFGALLLFPLWIGISLLASSRRIFSQGLLISFLLVIGWGLLLTRSRAVWIAFLVGLLLFVSLGRKNQFLERKAVSGILLLLGIGGLLFFSRGGLSEILARFSELWGTHFYSLINRWQLWEGALSAMMERPWGWGVGTFGLVLPHYRVHSDRFFIDYAHNEFLQVGVDLGIPGMILLAGFVLFYIQKARSFLKKRETADSQKSIGAGFLVLWISLFLVSQVDFPLRIFATAILFATFLGLSACLFEFAEANEAKRRVYLVPRSDPAPSPFFKKGLWVVSWILIFLSNFILIKQLFAELHFNEGEKLEENFQWVKAQTEYEKAVHLAPSFGPYHEALGSLSERRGGVSFDRAQKKTLLDKAIQAYQEASRLQPYRASTRYFLASLYERQGDSVHAQSEFLKAIALEPTNGLFISEYGYFAVRHSLVDEAIRIFEKLKNLSFRGEMKGDFTQIVRLCYRLTQDYDQLLRVIPDDIQGHNDLGRLMGENGRWDLAQKEFEQVMVRGKGMYSDYRGYFENVGRPVASFYLSHNRFEEVLEIYKEAAARVPQDEEIKRQIEELDRKIHPPLPVGSAP